MDSPPPDLPDDLDALRAVAAAALARNADDAATIARQNLEIAKLKRQIYGPRSERTERLLDQMELELEELEADATEDEIAAERAAAGAGDIALGFSKSSGLATMAAMLFCIAQPKLL